MMRSIAVLFLYIGIVSFGGGLSIVPELRRLLVDGHPWLTASDFADGYAIGQLAPGPNMLCVVFYGYRIGGAPGGLIAMTASFGPGAIASSILGASWQTLATKPWVTWLRRGLVPVGCGLMAAGVLVLARSSLHGIAESAIAIGAFVAVQSKKASNARAVVLAGALGAVLGHAGVL